MFLDPLTIVAKTRSAVAENGILAITSPLKFRKTSTSDNGRVTRANNALGELVISQAPTKEYGSGGKRTLVRFNLKQNGTLPGASAHLVVTSAPGLEGPARASEALGLLINSLFTMALQEEDFGDLIPGDALQQGAEAGWPNINVLYAADSSAEVDAYLASFIKRMISGEA
jgi:hypothetical protein